MPGRGRGRARASATRLLLANAVAWLCTAVLASAGAAAERLPASSFAEVPDHTHFALAPGGAHLAAVSPLDDLQSLVIVDPESGRNLHRIVLPEPKDSPIWLGDGERRLGGFWWVTDDRLLASVELMGGHQTFLLLINRDGTAAKEVRHRPSKPDLYHEPDVPVSLLLDDPEHVLVPFARLRLGSLLGYEVRALEVASGQSSTLERAVPRVFRWFADPTGAVRAGYAVRKGQGFLLYRDKGEGQYRELKTLGGAPIDLQWLEVLGLGKGPLVYVASRHDGDRFAVYVYDVLEGRFSPQVFSHAEVDVSGPLVLDPSGQPLGVHFVDDAPRIHWFDEAWRERQRRVDRAFPGRINRIESWDRGATRLVVRSESDRHAPSYALHGGAVGEPIDLGRHHPDLEPRALAATESVRIAIPGFELHAVLARPPASEGPVPFLVDVRGGGFERAHRGFDPQLQFLASRGWGVLRVNGRGTPGFGRRLETAADGRWASAAVEDAAAAVRWLVERGLADPERICLFGSDYGGYAALMGVVRQPELYRCAVSIGGITDLDRLLASRRRHYDAYLWQRRLAGRSEASSPIHQVSEIERPVFLAHGEQDRVVAPEHSTQLAKALDKAGKPHTLLLLPHDGHSIEREDARIDLYTALESFLTEQLENRENRDGPQLSSFR